MHISCSSSELRAGSLQASRWSGFWLFCGSGTALLPQGIPGAGKGNLAREAPLQSPKVMSPVCFKPPNVASISISSFKSWHIPLNTRKWNCQTALSNPEPVTHLSNILSVSSMNLHPEALQSSSPSRRAQLQTLLLSFQHWGCLQQDAVSPCLLLWATPHPLIHSLQSWKWWEHLWHRLK